MKRYLGIFLICILMAACSQKGSQQQRGNSGDASPRAEMTVKYATGFSVRDSSGVRLLDIGASDHFALVRSDDAAVPSGYQKVRVPISSTICCIGRRVLYQLSHQGSPFRRLYPY